MRKLSNYPSSDLAVRVRAFKVSMTYPELLGLYGIEYDCNVSYTFKHVSSGAYILFIIFLLSNQQGYYLSAAIANCGNPLRILMSALFWRFHITIYSIVPYGLLGFAVFCRFSTAAQSSQNSNSMTIGIGGSIIPSFAANTSDGQTISSNAPRPPQVPLDVERYPVAPPGLELQQVHVFVRHGESPFFPSYFSFPVLLWDLGMCTVRQ